MEYKNDKTANRRRYKSRYHSPHNYKTKRSKSENRAAILIGIATFVVLAALILVFTFGDSIYGWLDNTFHPSSITDSKAQSSTIGIATEPPAENATQTSAFALPTEAPTDPVAQNADFNKLLTAAGLNSASLSGSQLILVQTNGTNATVYTYEKDEQGVWQQKFSPVKGYTGEGGAADNSVPYDSVTPKGTYNIEYAMGVNYDPGTLLSYNEIYEGMLWVTDPNSVNYNRLVDETTEVDFEDCQDLSEYTLSYPYAIVFDYNRNPVDSAKGCAKFLHVSDHPTYGGIGISESDLQDILLWLDPVKTPQISIF